MSGGLHEARKKALEKATIPKALLDKYDVEVTDTAFVISEKNTRPQIDKRKVQIHYEDRFLYVNATSYSDYNHKDTPEINIRACKVTKEQVEFLHNVPQIDAEAIESTQLKISDKLKEDFKKERSQAVRDYIERHRRWMQASANSDYIF